MCVPDCAGANEFGFSGCGVVALMVWGRTKVKALKGTIVVIIIIYHWQQRMELSGLVITIYPCLSPHMHESLLSLPFEKLRASCSFVVVFWKAKKTKTQESE